MTANKTIEMTATAIQFGTDSFIRFADSADEMANTISLITSAIAQEYEANEDHFMWGLAVLAEAWDRQMAASAAFVGVIFSVAQWVQGSQAQEVEMDNDIMDMDFEDLSAIAAFNSQHKVEGMNPSRITHICNIIPFKRSQPQQAENYEEWTVAELRSLFNRRRLEPSSDSKRWTWRNAHGKGKHLRKQEMLNILMEVSAA